MLPTWPIVAMQSTCTWRTSPEGSFTCAYSPSFATSCAAAPALRTSWPPLPLRSSRLWIMVPAGIAFSGSALPGRMSALSPVAIAWPTFSPSGARM